MCTLHNPPMYNSICKGTKIISIWKNYRPRFFLIKIPQPVQVIAFTQAQIILSHPPY